MSAIAARRARLAAKSSCEATPEPGPSSDTIGAHAEEENSTSAREDLVKAQKRRVNRSDADANGKRRRARRRVVDAQHVDDVAEADAALEQCHETFFVPRSNGQRKNYEVESPGSVVCALNAGEAMALKGCGTIQVLHGCVEINGARLSAQHRESHVFAPSNAALPIIRVLSNESIVEEYVAAPQFVKKMSVGALLRISELKTTNLSRIGDACPTFGRDLFTCKKVDDWSLKSFSVVQEPTNGNYTFVSPEWRSALADVENHFSTASSPICLVRGPKRVGKSTFSRFSLQRLLTSSAINSPAVAYLDTDLGQPEFGLSETIALHVFDSANRQTATSSPLHFAPSWASHRQAVASRFLGELSPRNDPDEYIKSITSLLHVYRSQWQIHGIPLLVNTQGWVKGLGADLLGQLEQILSPTLIIDIVEDSSSGTTVAWRNSCDVLTIQAPPMTTREKALNASETRQMSMSSYFYMTNVPHSNLVLSKSGLKDVKPVSVPSWDFSVPLVSQRPFVVDVRSGLRGGIHLISNAAQVDSQLRLLSLNGSHVALIMTDRLSNEDGRAAQGEDPWMPMLQQPMPTLSRSQWLGTAIVRSIDIQKGELHLVCPIDSLAIRLASHDTTGGNAMALVKGSPAELPVWLSLDRHALQSSRKGVANGKHDVTHMLGVALHSVPYLDFTEGRDDTLISMKKRRIRRNLLRPSQRRQAGGDA